MQAEASQRAWLERKDSGSRDTHMQDWRVLEKACSIYTAVIM